MNDLLWSDPDPDVAEWAENRRGCGCRFGPDALNVFLKAHRLWGLVRSHQAMLEGIVEHWHGCITCFSSSNYGGQGNSAAIMEIRPGGSWEARVLEPFPWLILPIVVN